MLARDGAVVANDGGVVGGAAPVEAGGVAAGGGHVLARGMLARDAAAAPNGAGGEVISEPALAAAGADVKMAPSPLLDAARAQHGPDALAEDSAEQADEEYDLEKIVNVRVVNGVPQFRARWLGYTSHADTWEPTSHLLTSPHVVRSYLEHMPARRVEQLHLRDIVPPQFRPEEWSAPALGARA